MNPERYLSNFRGSYHLHSLILIIQYHQTRASFVRLSDIWAVADVCNKVVQNLIYEIRGKRVMLDSDLARLYGVETRALKQAVRKITICDLGEKRTWFKHQVYAFLAHYKPYNQLLLS